MFPDSAHILFLGNPSDPTRSGVRKGCVLVGNAIHYFVNTNGSQGFRSFFLSNFGTLGQLLKLDDYPGALVQDIIGKVCTRAQEKGYALEIIHNCLDNQPEGVILPQLHTGLLNIPAYVDYGYTLSRLLDNDAVRETKERLLQAHEHFAKAKTIHDDWEKIYISHMNFSKLNQFTSQTILELLGPHTQNQKGSAVHRFFGAATKDGPVDYIANLTEGISKRYFIKGRPGTGKSTFLKKFAERAVHNGFRTEIYHCSFDPDSLDLVIVRGLDLCLFDSTAPHEYSPSREGDEILDFYEVAVQKDTDEQFFSELSELSRQYKEQMNLARERISQADLVKKREEDSLLLQINPEKSKNSTNKILQKLFVQK